MIKASTTTPCGMTEIAGDLGSSRSLVSMWSGVMRPPGVRQNPLGWTAVAASARISQSFGADAPVLSVLRVTLGVTRQEVSNMSKPSKTALSKAGRTLSSDSSSKSAKSKAGSTLGKG